MSEAFDPYYSWLGIPPVEQPADYYRLLGLSRFESNAEAITNAVERQIRHLRSFAIGPHSEFTQQLLNEVTSARICLLNPDKKAAYDQSLRVSDTATHESHAPVAADIAPQAPPTPFESLAPSAALVPQEVLPPMTLPVAVNSSHPAPTTNPSSPIVLRQRRSHGRPSAQNKNVRQVISIVIGGLMGCVIGWVIIFVYLPKLAEQKTQAQRTGSANNVTPAPKPSRATPPSHRSTPRVPPATPKTPQSGSAVAERSPERGEEGDGPTGVEAVASKAPDANPTPSSVRDLESLTSKAENALSGRENEAKKTLLAAYGGTAETENAVELALDWLKRNQQSDGTWSLAGPYSDGVAGLENPLAATAMALLAFQGAGNTHRSGKFKANVKNGMDALLKMQDGDGCFFRTQRDLSSHRLYSQAQATIAVCELYGMTKDSSLRKSAQLAIDYATSIQANDGRGGGGWRYQPGRDVDTSVTGWFVIALRTGEIGGLSVPGTVTDRISRFLDNVEATPGEFVRGSC